MINNRSIDPDVALAASQALEIINEELGKLPAAESFDYGGHLLKVGEYDVCQICTRPIAEAQQAHDVLEKRAEKTDDPSIREHLDLAAELFRVEAEAAVIRAELHNGLGSEKIIDRLNGFKHERKILDDYSHSHHQGADQ